MTGFSHDKFCSCCGKPQVKAEAMFAAPTVFICAACIDQFSEMLRFKRLEIQRFSKNSNIISFKPRE